MKFIMIICAFMLIFNPVMARGFSGGGFHGSFSRGYSSSSYRSSIRSAPAPTPVKTPITTNPKVNSTSMNKTIIINHNYNNSAWHSFWFYSMFYHPTPVIINNGNGYNNSNWNENNNSDFWVNLFLTLGVVMVIITCAFIYFKKNN